MYVEHDNNKRQHRWKKKQKKSKQKVYVRQIGVKQKTTYGETAGVSEFVIGDWIFIFSFYAVFIAMV